MNFFLIHSPSYFIHSIYAYLLTYLFTPLYFSNSISPPSPTPIPQFLFFSIFLHLSTLYLFFSFLRAPSTDKKDCHKLFSRFKKSLLHFHNIIKFPKLKSKAQKIHVAVSEYFSLPLSSTESCFDNVYIRMRINERNRDASKWKSLHYYVWYGWWMLNLFFDVTARQINPKIVWRFYWWWWI